MTGLSKTDDFIRQYGLKHHVTFKEYQPGETTTLVTLNMKDFHMAEFLDMITMAYNRDLEITFMNAEVLIQEPKDSLVKEGSPRTDEEEQLLQDFWVWYMAQYQELQRNLPEKGLSYRDLGRDQLHKLFEKHYQRYHKTGDPRNLVNLANISGMLYRRRMGL